MLGWMSATDVAFATVAVTQAVLAIVWLFGYWLVGDTRRAALHWAAFAACSSMAFVLLTAALHLADGRSAEFLRALANLLIVLAVVSLQRGICLFTGHQLRWRWHSLALAIAVLASWIGMADGGGALRVAVFSAMLAVLSVGIARDLYRYGHHDLHLRHPWLMALPGVVTAAGYLFRGLRVLAAPDTVLAEITRDSGLNVTSGLGYLVTVLAFHGALFAMVVGRLVADLRHRARHDDLTGLLNRAAIEAAIEAQIRRSLRTGEPFSVLMFDLDHFKSINDRFGHAAGDEALRHVAATLQAGVREIDEIARVGGEEFLALMPGAELEASAPVAERLRAEVAVNPVPLGVASVPITVSIGVARWTGPGEDLLRLLARADAALYEAKQRGRDRVIAAGAAPPVARQAPPAASAQRG